MSISTVEELNALPQGKYNVIIGFTTGMLEVDEDKVLNTPKTFRFIRGQSSLFIRTEDGIIYLSKLVCGFVLTQELGTHKTITIID